jgi:hypothetical protein
LSKELNAFPAGLLPPASSVAPLVKRELIADFAMRLCQRTGDEPDAPSGIPLFGPML